MKVNYNELVWRQATQHEWRRDLDETERYWAQVGWLHDIDGRRPFEVTGHVSLEIETDSTTTEAAEREVHCAMVQAWCAIRQDHPTIASWVDYDFGSDRFTKIYSILRSQDERQEWIHSTLIPIDTYPSGVEFANSDPPTPELPTMFVVTPCRPSAGAEYGGKSRVRRDLVFRGSHSIIDGTGTLLLLGNFLRHLSHALDHSSDHGLAPLDGFETGNLSPPYRIAAEIPPSPPSDVQKRIDLMHEQHVYFGKGVGSSQLPRLPLSFRNKATQVPGKHQRVEIIINQTSVARLLKACKGVGATVTHVFHAAIPLVLRNRLDKPAEAMRLKHVFDLLINERPFCKEPYSTPAHAVSAYHSGSSRGSTVEVDMPSAASEPSDRASRKEEFLRVLSDVQELYLLVRNDEQQGQLAPHIWAGFLGTLPKPAKKPLPGPPPRESPSASLSSLGQVDGIIPPRLGRIETYRPWVTGDEMSNGYGSFLITHRGELSLAAAYNKAWHEAQDVLSFLEDCKRLVFEALDIDN